MTMYEKAFLKSQAIRSCLKPETDFASLDMDRARVTQAGHHTWF
jgi:hypothetical protein